jgi:hypothetical protein
MSDYNFRVLRLKNPEECESFARNVEKGYPELAKEARCRAVELRAVAHGVEIDAEREALEAIYAVEEVLSQRHGKKVRAARTWQSVKRYGILQTVERTVSRSKPTDGYAALVEMGMDNFTFEAVVLRHQTLFQPETVERAKARIDECKNV